jgi:hypothetical protein
VTGGLGCLDIEIGVRSRIPPLPLFAGEEGPKPKAWEVRVFSESAVQTLSSHRFAAGPSSPVKNGRGDKGRR